MQSKESKKDSEKSQKKVKSNPEISLEPIKSIRKVQSQPETPIVSIEPLDQRIKKAETLKMIETFKSIGSRNDLPKYLTNPKSLAQRPKASKNKYEKAFGKSTDNPEDKDDRVLPLQSQNKKMETSKSFPSNKDSANEEFQSSFDENSREILKIDEGLHFTFK